MSSNDIPKVEQDETPASTERDLRTIGGEATEDQIQIIDLAVAVTGGRGRAKFIVSAAVDRALAILAEGGIPVPQVVAHG